jgi:membrane protein YqaA with SNARE-associated domain
MMSVFVGLVGIIGVFVLAYVAGSLFTGPPGAVVMALVMVIGLSQLAKYLDD